MTDNFEVKESPEFGRYSTIKKNVKAGEILFEEYPFVVGPKPNVPPVCLVCCNQVDGSENGPRCPDCHWPLCENCIGHNFHRKECKLFVANKVRFQDFASDEDPCMQLDCITPLRLLLEKESNPKRWNEEVSLMEHHEMSRRHTEQWKVDQKNIVEYLRGTCKLKDRFSEDLIQQACGILGVNAFEGRTSFASGCNIQCLFPKSGILAHSCVPNVTHSIYPSDQFKITVRASIDLKQGDVIYTTYTNLMVGTAQRHEHLMSGKYFICHCKRCSDPFELGTNFSSFKCSKCFSGHIYPADPFDNKCIWKCMQCDFSTTSMAIQKVLSVIQSDVDSLQCIEFGPKRLEKCERLFRKYRGVFHPCHYLQISLQQNLIELYGRVAGYGLEELSDNILKHKMELCKQVLSVLNILYPGKTRTRAMLLYDLHAPIVLAAKNAYTSGIIQNADLKAKLKEAIGLLEECTTILEWEDVASVEHTIAQIGKQYLQQLREGIKAIG